MLSKKRYRDRSLGAKHSLKAQIEISITLTRLVLKTNVPISCSCGSVNWMEEWTSLGERMRIGRGLALYTRREILIELSARPLEGTEEVTICGEEGFSGDSSHNPWNNDGRWGNPGLLRNGGNRQGRRATGMLPAEMEI